MSGRGLSGKKGGKIEFLYHGKDGGGTVYLTPLTSRHGGFRGGMRLHPSQLWQYSPQHRR